MSTFVYEPDLQFLDNSCTRQGEGIEIDPTAEIHPNVLFRGKVKIGKHCQVEAGVVFAGDGITIGDYTVIKANASLRGVMTIGNHVMIGEQVNIEGGRPGDYIGTATSLIADKAIIGDGTIIGPGTVMHGTQIGQNTYVGIRCAFDYNTRIGDNCVIANGSGTVVDQIIPCDSLAAGNPACVLAADIDDDLRLKSCGVLPQEVMRKVAYRLKERHQEGLSVANFGKDTQLNIAPGAYVHPTAILEGKITIGENTVIDAGSILIGEITIGNDTNVAINTVIKGDVTIGERTIVKSHVSIDASRGYEVDILMGGACNPIAIGKNVFIDQSTNLRGSSLEDSVTMGQSSGCDFGSLVQEGACIGSVSVVAANNAIGKNTFAEGCPAKIIKTDITDLQRKLYYGFVPTEMIDESIPDQAKKRAEQAKIKNIQIHPDTLIEHGVWFEGNIKIGQYVWIDLGAVFTGDVEIGYNSLVRCNVSFHGKVKVGKQTHLYDQIPFDGECVVGDYCWMNHGAAVSNATIGEDASVSLSAAADYHSTVADRAIVSNRTALNAGGTAFEMTRVEGIPARVVNRFMDLRDRQLYFGVSPRLWTPEQGKWIEEDIISRRKI